MFSLAGPAGRRSQGARRRPGAALALYPALAVILALVGVALVAFLLWPRWPGATLAPDTPSLPITVGGVHFNVPPAAIRVAVQRRAGAQERVDLAFLWPSLSAPDPAARPAPSEEPTPIDRLFLTIVVGQDALSPADRLRSIFPRYLANDPRTGPDGLLTLPFRDGTPYRGEDLFYDPSAPDLFVARCSRPGAGGTPGTCLLERRIGAADLTVRFPRDWLAEWRAIAGGIDRLIASLRPPAG